MTCSYHSSTNASCQFAISNSDLIDFNGKKWCEFHLPISDNRRLLRSPKGSWSNKHIDQFNTKIFKLIEIGIKKNSTVNLTGVVFPANISFSYMKLPNMTLKEAVFNGSAIFDDATFQGDVDFIGTQFRSNTAFESVRFGGNVLFNGVLNQENASTFNFVSFKNATFEKIASFMNRKFLSTTLFNDAHFQEAPLFHGSSLHQDTHFPSEENFLDIKGTQAAKAYRTLRHAMENNKLRQEQAMFFALEQKSMRNHCLHVRKKISWDCLLSWLYEKTANYGRSTAKPLVFLSFTTLLFYSIYIHLTHKWFSPLTSTGDILSFSLSQIVRPFNIWTVKSVEQAQILFYDNIFLIQLLASIESLIGISFMTLFIIALRWRFKKG